MRDEDSPEAHRTTLRFLLDLARRRLPREDFEKHALWDEVLISLSVSLGAKSRILTDLIGEKLMEEEARDLRRDLIAFREIWEEEVGVAAANAIHCRAGLYLIDPDLEEELSSLRRGDPDEDAALLLCIARLDSATPEMRHRRLREAAALAPRSAAVWETLATTLLDQTIRQREKPPDILRDAAQWAEESLRRDPSRPRALHVSGRALCTLSTQEEGEEKRRHLETACRHLAESARLSPGEEVFKDWGYALGETALTADDEAGRAELLREACRCFDEALRREPEDLGARSGAVSMRWALAHALDDQAERSRVLVDVAAVLQETLQQMQNTGMPTGSMRWVLGCVLAEQAKLEPDPGARRSLLHRACAEFERLDGLGSEEAEAYVRWGCALLDLAGLNSSKARQRLIEKAGKMFAQAFRDTEGDADLLLSVADAWLALAPSASGREVQEVARRASEAAQQANRAEPGAGDYSLACALSRLGEMAEAAELITRALARNPEDTRQALEDPDLRPLWDVRSDLRDTLAAGVDEG